MVGRQCMSPPFSVQYSCCLCLCVVCYCSPLLKCERDAGTCAIHNSQGGKLIIDVRYGMSWHVTESFALLFLLLSFVNVTLYSNSSRGL